MSSSSQSHSTDQIITGAGYNQAYNQYARQASNGYQRQPSNQYSRQYSQQQVPQQQYYSSTTSDSKVKMNPVPVTVNVISDASDLQSESSSGDSDQANVFRIVSTEYPFVVRKSIADLKFVLQSLDRTSASLSPPEQFVMKQATLAGQGIYARLKNEKLSYQDVREQFENIACLIDFMYTKSLRGTVCLCQMFCSLMETLATLTEYLEDVAKHHITNWAAVREYYAQTYGIDRPLPPIESVPLNTSLLKSPRLIGVGSFGTVHLAKLFGSLPVCVKVIVRRSSGDPPFASTLVGCLVNNPLFCRIHATFMNQCAYLCIMEYVCGIDVGRMLHLNNGLPTNVTLILIEQLCLAVEFLHYMGFIHRDIKPSNMVMTSHCRMKLIDFDTCKTCMGMFSTRLLRAFLRRTTQEFNDKEVVGSLGYMAPEILKKEPYGRACDWWSVGVTTYAIFYGRIPFRSKNDEEVKQKIISGRMPFPQKSNGSTKVSLLRKFIRSLCKVPVHERLCSGSYNEFYDDPLFEKVDWQVMEQGEKHLKYEQVDELMTVENDEKFPTVRKLGAREMRTKKLWFDMTRLDNSQEKSIRHTFSSDSFRILANYLRANPNTKITPNMLDEEPLYLCKFEDTPYKFKGYFKQNRFQ